MIKLIKEFVREPDEKILTTVNFEPIENITETIVEFFYDSNPKLLTAQIELLGCIKCDLFVH